MRNSARDSAGQNKPLKYLNSRGESRNIKSAAPSCAKNWNKKRPAFFEAGLFLFVYLKKLSARSFKWGNNDHAYHD
jgi:hypothetical protein